MSLLFKLLNALLDAKQSVVWNRLNYFFETFVDDFFVFGTPVSPQTACIFKLQVFVVNILYNLIKATNLTLITFLQAFVNSFHEAVGWLQLLNICWHLIVLLVCSYVGSFDSLFFHSRQVIFGMWAILP